MRHLDKKLVLRYILLMSLLFFSFQIVGTREGTAIAALGTGTAVKFWQKIIKNNEIIRRITE